jgi:hypothetical protein
MHEKSDGLTKKKGGRRRGREEREKNREKV